MNQVVPVELDEARAEFMQDLQRMQYELQDRAMALVAPMPLPPELTMQQVRVLSHIVTQPGISGHELGNRIGVSAPTASGLVERLAEKGLILREDDLDDRRVRRLHPTDAGRGVIRELDSMFIRILGVVVQHLSLDELDLLRRSSQAMLDALERAKLSGN